MWCPYCGSEDIERGEMDDDDVCYCLTCGESWEAGRDDDYDDDYDEERYDLDMIGGL